MLYQDSGRELLMFLPLGKSRRFVVAFVRELCRQVPTDFMDTVRRAASDAALSMWPEFMLKGGGWTGSSESTTHIVLLFAASDPELRGVGWTR